MSYAMLTYTVEQRRREIGIWLALGATRSELLRMILSGGLLPAVIGAGLGALIAPAAGRALSSLLYGVSPADAMAIVIAPAAILREQ